jgi:hypothetical protein
MEWYQAEQVGADLDTKDLVVSETPTGLAVRGILRYRSWGETQVKTLPIDWTGTWPPLDQDWDAWRLQLAHPDQPAATHLGIRRHYEPPIFLHTVTLASGWRVKPERAHLYTIRSDLAYRWVQSFLDRFEGPEKDGTACHWGCSGNGRLEYFHPYKGRVVVRWGLGEGPTPNHGASVGWPAP